MENEIEFAVFCIENVAQQLQISAPEVYAAIAERSNLLAGYIIPNFEVLHTQSREYIVSDIIDAMKESGVSV